MAKGNTGTALADTLAGGVVEQAREAGFIVVQDPIPVGPYFVTRSSGSVTPFGPYTSREEAESHLPEILRDEERARRLEAGYHVRRGVDKHWHVERPIGPTLGPFNCRANALDVAENETRESIIIRAENLQRLVQQRIQSAHIPVAFRGITLDTFSATTETLQNALDIAREYIRKFPNWRQGLLFCGEVVREHALTGKNRRQLLRESRTPRLTGDIRSMPLKDALEVWGEMNAQEKKTNLALMRRKAAHEILRYPPGPEREALRQQVRSALSDRSGPSMLPNFLQRLNPNTPAQRR